MRIALVSTTLVLLLASGLVHAQDSQPAKTKATTRPSKASGPKQGAKAKTPEGPVFPQRAVEKVAVKLSSKLIQPGDVLRVVAKRKVVLTVARPPVTETRDVGYHVELTVTGAERDGTITSLKVNFLKVSGDGKRGAALSGTTYEVERDAKGKLALLDAKRTPVQDPYTEGVLRSLTEGWVGEPAQRFAGRLPTTRIEPGAKVTFEPQALLRLIELGTTIRDPRAAYRGLRKHDGSRLAVFDLRFTATAGRGQSTQLKGEVLVDPRTGIVELIELEGKLTLRQGGGPVSVRRSTRLESEGS